MFPPCLKKFTALFFLALLALSISACSQVKWIEGTHYTKISDSASEQKNVKEYFSFWCPHCYQAEPFMKELAKRLNEDTAFIKVHVNFMGFLPQAAQDTGTLALMSARASGNEAAFVDALFNAIHVERQSLNSLEDFATIYASSNNEDSPLKDAASAFAVKNLVKTNNAYMTEYRPHIKGVPAIIVNDQYTVALGSGLNMDELVELINWLSAGADK